MSLFAVMKKVQEVDLKVVVLPHAEELEDIGYAHEGDAGLDLRAALPREENVWGLPPNGRVLVPTGIKVEVPDGYEIQIRPRSGLALNHGVTVLNTPGTVDSGYRNEIKVLLINHGDRVFHIKRGDRIAQMVINQFVKANIITVPTLSESERGEKGYGSTGVD
jgi:dUTP pyrophosphatase